MTQRWNMSQLTEEWDYRYEERLGILCGAGTPEPWMEKMARDEASAAIEALLAQAWRAERKDYK